MRFCTVCFVFAIHYRHSNFVSSLWQSFLKFTMHCITVSYLIKECKFIANKCVNSYEICKVYSVMTYSSQQINESNSNSMTSNESIDDTKPESTFDAQVFRKENNITVSGESIPTPFDSFSCYEWPQQLKTKLELLKYEKPTAIQAQTLPIILAKRDCLAIARSGSGKSLSFILPALVKTLRGSLDEWPKCLILTPTRELTHQIDNVIRKFRFVRSVCLYGGVSRDIQMMQLREANPHIMIATPGRLNDILDRAVASLQYIDYVVLDEADLTLKYGFEKAFVKVMEALPKNKQTVMFSATWPPSVQTLADRFLSNYVRVTVDQNTSNTSLTVNKNITQIIELCSESEKIERLFKFLHKYVPTITGLSKTIIFVNKASTSNRLVNLLKKEYMYARAVNKTKQQPERDFVIREFQKGSIPILIATDVVSRGLDFENVKYVINFDYPQDPKDYIHRIGRTGRHSKEGTSFTLFTPEDSKCAPELVNILRESQQHINQDLIKLCSEVNNCEIN